MATCRLFGASRQVYYRAVRSVKKRKQIAQQVVQIVEQVRMELPRLGGRKLYYLLQPKLSGLSVGRDKLFSILKANHMLIEPKRRYHITTDSHHRFRKHKNLIDDIKLTRPEQVWVADITYVGNRENPMYLAMITDAYSKKIVGHNVSDSLETKGAAKALRIAIGNKQHNTQQLVHHSDRGFQYCSDQYQKILKNCHLKCSMTETYDPYANAIAERVNGIIKHEFLLNDYNLDLNTMRQLIAESINIYNEKRPHLSCQMLTPNQMHKQNEIKIKTYKKKRSSKNIFDTS